MAFSLKKKAIKCNKVSAVHQIEYKESNIMLISGSTTCKIHDSQINMFYRCSRGGLVKVAELSM